MASIFHGFRVDNAHSTPIHVGAYFLRKARKCNHNLLVFAELFLDNQEFASKYVKMLGFNALMKEVIYHFDSLNLYKYLKDLNKGDEKYLSTSQSMND